MFPQIVQVEIVDQVEVLGTRVPRGSNDLEVYLSRPWYSLSDELQTKLLGDSRPQPRVGQRRLLKEGWGLSFVPAE